MDPRFNTTVRQRSTHHPRIFSPKYILGKSKGALLDDLLAKRPREDAQKVRTAVQGRQDDLVPPRRSDVIVSMMGCN